MTERQHGNLSSQASMLVQDCLMAISAVRSCQATGSQHQELLIPGIIMPGQDCRMALVQQLPTC